MTLLTDAKIINTGNSSKVGTLYSIVPDSGLADLDITRATTATRINVDGQIESVAVNEPQLDYSLDSCPSLLLEPERTNLYIYSDDYTTNQTGTNVVVTANAATSPDGTTNATKFAVSSGGYRLTWGTFFSVSSANNGFYTCSFYAKNINATEMKVGIFDGSTFANIVTPFSYISQVNTSTWTRVSFAFQVPSGTTLVGVEVVGTGSLGDFLLFGHQIEAGEWPQETSYIPTTSASVTRNKTYFSKSGISSLTNNSEGVLYLEFAFLNVINGDQQIMSIGENYGASVNIGRWGNGYLGTATMGGTNLTFTLNFLSPIPDLLFHKQAIKYKSGETAIWWGGVEYVSSTTTATPANQLDKISSTYNGIPNFWGFEGRIKSIVYYDTVLSDSQLLDLTSP